MARSLRSVLDEHRERLFLGGVLALSSAAGLALLAFRFYYSGEAGYEFMPWNLFLAWVPLGLAVVMGWVNRSGRAAAGALAAVGFVWLLFFPNAPYLLTEFMHLDPDYGVSERPLRALAALSPRRDVPVWYDALLILMFAWTGLVLAFVSLQIVQQVVRERAGPRAAWAMAVAVLGLGGFGVSLGRFERWNSWDVFSQPIALLSDVLGRLVNPLAHPRTTAVTVLVSTFLILAYLSIGALGALSRVRGRERCGAAGA